MYTVTTDDQSQQQVDALPAEALAPFAEARATPGGRALEWRAIPQAQAGQSHASPDVRPGQA
ncbi:MAG: hypothetical protein ACRDTH_06050, partial [Pseudonocardiaceae bacterium]